MEFDLLFWIISRVSKDLRVKVTLYSIATEYHNSMLTGFYKLIVKQNFPLRMVEFPMSVHHKVSTGALTIKVPGSKVLETIWKLEDRYA
jgi:hypothetical protein